MTRQMTAPSRSTVLVVDDSPVDVSVLREILRPEHQVLCAAGPEPALALLRSGARPDLLVLDVMMPGRGGLEMCRQLKLNPQTATLPVIFVTARDGVEDEAAGFEAGAVDYVTKPVNPHLLRARVRTHIELARARARLEEQNQTLRENARLREEMEHIARHDLKNPLMVIMNVPGLLMRQPNITDEQRQRLAMVETAARRMVEMINRSVDLIKMENLVYEVHPEPVDSIGVIRHILADLQAAADQKLVRFELLLSGRPADPGDAFVVSGEELLVYSMLFNLIRNAVEASPAGATVSISFRDEDPQAIIIHNRGAIPERIRGRFFEKFTTAGKPGGTGIGAYSARMIARTLGGGMDFATSDGEGTTITIRLPRIAS